MYESEIWQTPEEQLKIAAVTYGFKEVYILGGKMGCEYVECEECGFANFECECDNR